MFAYGAALVELGIVSKVNINFLIVGHTHSNLDQYFSVYSKKIKRCEFIGSVLAMHELYDTAHSGKFLHLRPRNHEYEQLRFIHDWVAYFVPIVNTRIKWYKVLYRFQIFLLHGRAGPSASMRCSHRWTAANPNGCLCSRFGVQLLFSIEMMRLTST